MAASLEGSSCRERLRGRDILPAAGIFSILMNGSQSLFSVGNSKTTLVQAVARIPDDPAILKKWNGFVDLDGDRTKDLVETIAYCDGEEPDQMSCKTTVNAYLIKDLQLVPAPPGLIQTNFTESERQGKSDFNGPADMQGHKSQT